jgi:hypothetical protein
VPFSCSEKEKVLPDQIPSISLTEFSGCGDIDGKTKSSNSFDDTLSVIIYSYDALTKELQINHINAAFNCCPGKLYCETSLSNDTLYVKEYEQSSQCKCNCLYDLNLSLGNIEERTYILSIVEPYISNQEKLISVINLKIKKEGIFVALRKKYPWG